MITLQELITRGRFIMAEAPSRKRVFEAVDGRRTANDIADLLGRHVNNVHRDLAALQDVGLIQPMLNGDDENRERRTIWEKLPLARTVPARYFEPVGKRPAKAVDDASPDSCGKSPRSPRGN